VPLVVAEKSLIIIKIPRLHFGLSPAEDFSGHVLAAYRTAASSNGAKADWPSLAKFTSGNHNKRVSREYKSERLDCDWVSWRLVFDRGDWPLATGGQKRWPADLGIVEIVPVFSLDAIVIK